MDHLASRGLSRSFDFEPKFFIRRASRAPNTKFLFSSFSFQRQRDPHQLPGHFFLAAFSF
jgi:hypothetical protein